MEKGDTGSSINAGPYQSNSGQLIEYEMIRESPFQFIAGFNNHKEKDLFVADKTFQIPSTKGIITLVLRGTYEFKIQSVFYFQLWN